MKTQIFLTGLAIVALTTFATAQNPRGGNGNCKGTAKCSAFVDANQNGICDTYETRTTNASVGKRDGTGNCVGQGKGNNSSKRQGSGNGSCRRL